MQVETIIMLVIIGVLAVIGIVSIIVAIVRGDMKKFIQTKMIEAEQQDLDGAKKLEYVLVAVNEKYHVLKVLLNVKKFVEGIISITKQINYKKQEAKAKCSLLILETNTIAIIITQ